MSRVGKNPIALSEKVKVNLTAERAEVSGPLGNVKINIPKGIKVKNEDKKIIVERSDDSQQQRALHGLTRQLIFNAVSGVEKG